MVTPHIGVTMLISLVTSLCNDTMLMSMVTLMCGVTNAYKHEDITVSSKHAYKHWYHHCVVSPCFTMLISLVTHYKHGDTSHCSHHVYKVGGTTQQHHKKIIDKCYGYYIRFNSRDPFNPKLEDNLVKLTTIFSWPMWVAIFSL